MTEKQTDSKEPFDFDREFADFERRIMDIVPDELDRQTEYEDSTNKDLAERSRESLERVRSDGRTRAHREVGKSAIVEVVVDKKPSHTAQIQVVHLPTPGGDVGMSSSESAWAYSKQHPRETDN